MNTEPLYHDPDFTRLYEAQCPWSADTEYCLALARSARSVLDLGCGTGRFCLRLAQEGLADICGADPARAMLAIGQSRPFGNRVRWELASAQDLRLNRRFDLIVMTGHAFQTLLTSADRGAALHTIALHLEPGGHFIFDSRNPAAREWEGWTPELTHNSFIHPDLGEIAGWISTKWDAVAQIAEYEQTYYIQAEARTIRTRARIAFPSQLVLAAEIAAAGLRADRWMGEWDGRPFTFGAREIIPYGTLT